MEKPSIILLFDGYCVLCNAAVDFVLKQEKKHKIKVGAMQSPEGQRVLHHYGLPSTYQESVVLIYNREIHLGSTAALRIARLLGGGWPLFYPLIFIPRGWRDRIYHWIGTNRYTWFGKNESCRIPSKVEANRFLHLDQPL
uniref:thiol-disulfide oxidoreductase DCC family protein n=1 Tax=Algoriphagus sp. TaxID=1872435 RepID=UPI00404793C2